MITKDDIATYRATYPREHLDQKAKEQNLHCGTPLGSVLALNTLCDAYEEIEKQRDELLAAAERQFNADHVLINMPHGCTKDEHETALNEHTNAHYELRKVIARVKGQQ